MVNPNKYYFIDENLSSALLNDYWQHVVNYLDITRLLNSNFIVAMFSSTNNVVYPHILIYNKILNNYYIISPRSNTVHEQPRNCAQALIKLILKQIRIFDDVPLVDTPPHFVSVCGSYNYLILYGIIKGMFEGSDINSLNIPELVRHINMTNLIPLKPDNSSPQLLNEPLRKTYKEIKLRREYVQELVNKFHTANSDKWLNVIYECVQKNKPIKKEHCPYLGSKPQGPTSFGKWEMRQQYYVDRKKTIRKILNSDEVNQWPTSSDISDHFSRSVPENTDWSRCPHLRDGDIEIDLNLITPAEILKVLKKTNKSSPGEDEITYADLKLADPDCILLSYLFNEILVSKSIPEKWKSFKTILIPKPGKTGSYNDVNNWRLIALLATSYKLFTSVLANRLALWAKMNDLIHHAQNQITNLRGVLSTPLL